MCALITRPTRPLQSNKKHIDVCVWPDHVCKSNFNFVVYMYELVHSLNRKMLLLTYMYVTLYITQADF